MPASERFTMSTWIAWSSTERLRCSTPTPPWRAIAIAIRASVTVSIGLESSGVCRVSDRDSRVEVLASLGRMSEAAGQQEHVVERQPQRRKLRWHCRVHDHQSLNKGADEKHSV